MSHEALIVDEIDEKIRFILWCLLLRLAPLPPALGQVPPYEEKAETVLNSGCLKLTQQGIVQCNVRLTKSTRQIE